MSCPFCDIESTDPGQVTLSNEYVLFLQEPRKVLIGSGIIIPRAHRRTVFDLTPAEWEASYDLLQQAKELLDKVNAPGGYNVGWNCGSVAGQDIFHAHMHVIPRFGDEPLVGKGIRYHIKQEANKRPGQ